MNEYDLKLIAKQDIIDNLTQRMRLACEVLLGPEVQQNKAKLGALGMQDIDDAVAMLTDREG